MSFFANTQTNTEITWLSTAQQTTNVNKKQVKICLLQLEQINKHKNKQKTDTNSVAGLHSGYFKSKPEQIQ